MALRTASSVLRRLVTNAEAIDSGSRCVIIANVERVRCLEAFGDLASGARNIICLIGIVVEEDELFAVCKLVQNATLSRAYPDGKATLQAEPACRTN
jgi:hypothetical protein